MVTEEKVKTVEELTDKFKQAKSVIFTNYRGMDVETMNDLRSRLREEEVEFRVVKNTLAGFALENADLQELKDLLSGPVGVAFSFKDTVSAASVLDEFIEDNEVPEIRGGALEGNAVSLEQIESLAKIPTREELLGQVARGIQSPLHGLVNVLQGPLRNLAYTLQAIKDQKEE